MSTAKPIAVPKNRIGRFSPEQLLMVATAYFTHLNGTVYKVIRLTRDANNDADRLAPWERYQVEYAAVEHAGTIDEQVVGESFSRSLSAFFGRVALGSDEYAPRFAPTFMAINRGACLVTGIPAGHSMARVLTRHVGCLRCGTEFMVTVDPEPVNPRCLHCAGSRYAPFENYLAKGDHPGMWQHDLHKSMTDAPNPDLEKFLQPDSGIPAAPAPDDETPQPAS